MIIWQAHPPIEVFSYKLYTINNKQKRIERFDWNKRGESQQPEKCWRENTPEPIRSDCRSQWLRQIIFGFRHPLRRRTATVCGESVKLCPTVSRTNEQTRVRLHLRYPARYRHRTEGDITQPTQYSRHLNGDIRISPITLRSHRAHV